MASLLNNASLLLNPAGSIIAYKEDKIYPVLPNNGTCDFTFTGGDGGTRVNQDGYIEQTPANFMLNSGTTWNAYNVTVGTGIADPFGGTGAYAISNIDPGNITDYAYKGSNTMSLPAGTVITLSLYMFGTGTIATYVERGVAGTYWFDTKVHTLDPNKWTLFTHTYTVPTDASGVNVYVGNASGTTSTYVQVAFPMLNYGSTARPYQPTTDRLNYPRIDYKNGVGALLQEPARTNLITNSNGFDLWVIFGITVTTGSAISPDGTQNATLLTTTNTTNHQLYQSKSVTGALAFSVWAKKGNSRTFYLAAFNNGFVAYWDLDTGAVISTAGSGVSALPGEQYKDGWMRYTMLFTSVPIELQIGFLDTYYTGNSGAPWGVSTSVGTTGYIYGSQLEAGEFPTTYIPTTSATVTRPIEQFWKNDSSALSSTSWTFYMSGIGIGKNKNSSGANIDGVNWSFDSGGGPYGPNSLHNYANNLYYYSNVLGVTGVFGSIGATTQKLAVTKTGNTFKIFRNGQGPDTYTPAIDNNVWDSFRMFANGDAQGQEFSNNPSTVAIFQYNMTDAQAIELTTVRSGSGGNISYYGPYTIHTFTGSATFTPSFNGEVEVLVVAGGGGGGTGFYKSACGGGGGAGGLQYVSSYGVSAGTGITVTVGAGGAGGPAGNSSPVGDGTNGSNSVFGGITTIGGGGGTTYFDVNGKNGGSGGGAGGAGGYSPNGGNGLIGQGNNGGGERGTGQSNDSTSCGGGGGAGAVGATGVANQRGGNGGDGLPYSISGFSTYYAGGGGGGASKIGGGYGGLGGGGNGGNIDSDGSDAVDYTGGGGGGASSGPGNAYTGGGDGGNGIVIIRYLT